MKYWFFETLLGFFYVFISTRGPLQHQIKCHFKVEHDAVMEGVPSFGGSLHVGVSKDILQRSFYYLHPHDLLPRLPGLGEQIANSSNALLPLLWWQVLLPQLLWQPFHMLSWQLLGEMTCHWHKDPDLHPSPSAFTFILLLLPAEYTQFLWHLAHNMLLLVPLQYWCNSCQAQSACTSVRRCICAEKTVWESWMLILPPWAYSLFWESKFEVGGLCSLFKNIQCGILLQNGEFSPHLHSTVWSPSGINLAAEILQRASPRLDSRNNFL